MAPDASISTARCHLMLEPGLPPCMEASDHVDLLRRWKWVVCFFLSPYWSCTCCMQSGSTFFSATRFKTLFLLTCLNYTFYPLVCFGFCSAWLEECKWAKSGCQGYQHLPQAKQDLGVLKCFLCSQALFVPRRNVLDLSATVIFCFISLIHSNDCHM